MSSLVDTHCSIRLVIQNSTYFGFQMFAETRKQEGMTFCGYRTDRSSDVSNTNYS